MGAHEDRTERTVPSSTAMEHAVSIGPWEWLLLLGQATGITGRLAFKAGRALLTGQTYGLSFHQYIAFAAMRDYQSGLGAVGIQNLLPTTSKICTRHAKKHAIPLQTIQLPDATIAFRLGPSEARKVVVYFHGGGYMGPALGEHMYFASGYGHLSGQDVAVYILQYDLASENANHYPRQLRQAVSLMNHLVHAEKVSPSSITLLGDSAGAHLALGLLLHASHPNPQVPPLQLDDTPLSGAILISPWAAPRGSPVACTKADEQGDVLTAASLAYWARNFLGGAAPDPWNDPLTAPADWWGGLPAEKILVTYGGKELIREDAEVLCDRLQEHHAHTTVLSFPGESHVHMVMSRFLHLENPCESERAYTKWVSDHFRS